MRAVVMAGGRGTRLLPHTDVLPKCLLPVGDRPILAIALERLARAGVRRVDLCVGYLAEIVDAYLEQSPPERLELELHVESEPLGTAGALRTISGLDEPFLLLNGDVLTSLDFNDLMSHRASSDAAMSIAVQERVTEIGAGVLELQGDQVTEYVERPTVAHQASLGVYALSPRTVDHVPAGRVDVPDLVSALLAKDEDVRAYRFDGPWFDIGTADSYECAIRAFDAEPGAFLSDG